MEIHINETHSDGYKLSKPSIRKKNSLVMCNKDLLLKESKVVAL